MNYLSLINTFWYLDEEYEFSAQEIALYFFLLKTCNRLSWKNPFGQSNARLIARFGWGKTSFDTAKNNLKKAGLIDFKAGDGRNNVTQYELIGSHKDIAKGTQINTLYNNLSDTHSNTLSPTLSDTHSLTLSEPKPATSINVNKTKEENNTYGFDAFWLSYGKSADKEKCKRAWVKLSEEERALAIAAVPNYVSANPNKQYRKNPLTWLNGKCWVDQEEENGALPIPSKAPFKSKAVELINGQVIYENGLSLPVEISEIKKYNSGELPISHFDKN